MRIAGLLGLLLPLALRAQVWEPLNGPLAVEVREVEVNSSDILFFITSQGLQRSLDNGDTWELLDNGLPISGLTDLLIAPNDHVFVFGPSKLLYRSADNGMTWTLLNNGQSFLNATCLEADDLGTLFMGMATSSVNRSFDNGDTWSWTFAPASSVDMIAVGLGDTLYAANENSPFGGSIIRSIDGGSSWTGLSYLIPNTNTRCLFVNDVGHVFAGITQGSQLVRSMDGGQTWTQLDIGPARNVVSIIEDSTGGLYLSSYTSGVMHSADNGDTWAQVVHGLSAQYTTQLALNSSDHLFAASSIDLFESWDGGLSWTGTNEAVVTSGINEIFVNDSNHYFVSVVGGGVHRSTDQGFTWTGCNTGLLGSSISGIAANDGGHLYVSTQWGHLQGGIFRSLDNGDTWDLLTDTTAYSNEALMIAANEYIYASSENPTGIIRSVDNGSTWTTVLPSQNPCFGLAEVEEGTNERVLVGASSCLGGIIYTSDDNGSSWAMHELVVESGVARINSISTRPDGIVLTSRSLSAAPLVFRSEDNGDTWQPAAYGLPDTIVNTVMCHSTPGLALAGTRNGIYITNNDGDDWWPFSDGLTNMNVTAFAIDQNGMVLAGTNGGGVFRASLPVAVPEFNGDPFSLEQNIPNPANSLTSITYSLRTHAEVVMTMHDAQGRLITEVLNTRSAPGRHTVEVSTAALAPGIYTYSLWVDGARSTKRMAVEH